MVISESGNICLNNGLKVFAVANGMLLSTIVGVILTTAEVTLKIANKKKNRHVSKSNISI